ncbi:hypothetical protein Ndes2437A_g00634 [Nannochloris sp. 'desiccata']
MLDSFVRSQSPQWLSQTLKIKLETLTLEELFSNCWLLGRVADTADGLLKNNPYRCPPLELGNRPYRDVISDIERFHAVCEKLSIDDDSRIALADVEQRKAGTRVGLCLWDISDALRARGYTSEIPEFAPANDYALLRKAMPRETSRIAVEKYENGVYDPSLTAPRPRPTIPLLPLDTSPALQKYRARSAMSEEEKQKQKAAAKAATAAGKASTSSSTSSPTIKKETPGVAVVATPTAENASTAAAAAVKEPPPSLSKWLPTTLSSKKKSTENDGGNGGDGRNSGSPPFLSSGPTTPPTDNSTAYEDTDCAEEEEESSQGGIDVLAAILSPDKNKPAHTQVINALMRTAPGPTPAEEATSAASAPRSKRSLGGFVENVQVITSGRQASGRNNKNSTAGDDGGCGNHSARYVKSFSNRRSSAEPWWKTPLVGVLGAAAAVVVMHFVNGNKERGNRDAGAGRRGGVQHAGRW